MKAQMAAIEVQKRLNETSEQLVNSLTSLQTQSDGLFNAIVNKDSSSLTMEDIEKYSDDREVRSALKVTGIDSNEKA
jgi:hypothetical protein